MKEFYRRRLPHWQPMGGTFFVTFRLQHSLPKEVLQQLCTAYKAQKAAILSRPTNENKQLFYKARKRQFVQYDNILDSAGYGACFLRAPEQAQLVADEIHRWNEKLYDLLAYCIMPNHVQLLIDTALQLPEDLEFYEMESIEYQPLQNILKQIKGASARFVNLSLQKTGQFWQHESYDHWVRNARELDNIITYILNNPVKAGLVKDYQAWPFSFCKWM